MLTNIGTALQIKYFSRTFGGAGSYYDNASLAVSGTSTGYWTSGIKMSLKNKGQDAFLMAQGTLLEDDSRLMVLGNVDTSGTFKVDIGSPPTKFYAPIVTGPGHRDFNESPVYKIVYMRFLPTGSLAGE